MDKAQLERLYRQAVREAAGLFGSEFSELYRAAVAADPLPSDPRPGDVAGGWAEARAVGADLARARRGDGAWCPPADPTGG